MTCVQAFRSSFQPSCHWAHEGLVHPLELAQVVVEDPCCGPLSLGGLELHGCRRVGLPRSCGSSPSNLVRPNSAELLMHGAMAGRMAEDAMRGVRRRASRAILMNPEAGRSPSTWPRRWPAPASRRGTWIEEGEASRRSRRQGVHVTGAKFLARSPTCRVPVRIWTDEAPTPRSRKDRRIRTRRLPG